MNSSHNEVFNTKSHVIVDFTQNQSPVEQIERQISTDGFPIRWAIVSGNYNEESKIGNYIVEYTIISNYLPFSQQSLPISSKKYEKDVFVNIVPTGIQASVGGSLGDAMPINVVLAELGLLITHPNTCNAGPILIADRNKILYTEGSAIDAWSMNKYTLYQNKSQKIGIVIDSAVKDTIKGDRTINAIQGFYAHTGANFVDYIFTKENIGGKVVVSETGACVGTVDNLNTVFDACQKIINDGATQIAIFTVVDVPQNYWKLYFQGSFPNPVGGIESIITHSITQKFNIVSAHGPLINQEEEILLWNSGLVAPAAGLESANPFYPLCVLRGLMDAPNLINENSGISFNNVSAVFCPYSALGGIALLQSMHLNIPIFAVKENTTIMKAYPSIFPQSSIIEVSSYLEAIGIVIAVKQLYGSITLQGINAIVENTLVDQLILIASEYIIGLGINPQSLGPKQRQLWSH